MNHRKNRFDVAEEQVEAFRQRVPADERAVVSLGVPRDPEGLVVRVTNEEVPLKVRLVPKLTGRIANGELLSRYRHRLPWPVDDEPLMGLIVPFKDVIVIFVSEAFPPATVRFTLAQEAGHLALHGLPKMPTASQDLLINLSRRRPRDSRRHAASTLLTARGVRFRRVPLPGLRLSQPPRSEIDQQIFSWTCSPFRWIRP